MPSLLAGLTQNLNTLARPNKYRVEIGVPRTIGASTDIRSINTNCSAVAIPGVSMGTHDRRNGGGPMYKMPYDKIYAPVSMTFYNTVEFNERKFFEDWHNSINTGKDGLFEFYENYVSRIRILQLDSYQLPTYGVELIEAYPLSISEIQLGYDQENTIETFNVTFTYKRWERLDIEGTFVANILDGIDIGTKYITSTIDEFLT